MTSQIPSRGNVALVAALPATLALGLFTEAHAACQLEQLAEFHVERVAGAPIVAGEINGHPVRFVIQTGTPFTYITVPGAQELGLTVHEYKKRTLYGVDGNENLRTANVSDMRVGDLRLKDYTLGVVSNEIHSGNSGVSLQLGADLLGQFATEFDLAAGVVRLFRPQDCKPEQMAYWSPTYFQIELQPAFVADIKVNGSSQKARFVSGSATSYISLEAAKEAGVMPDSPGVEPGQPIVGWTATPIPIWIGRFDSVQFGAETIKNVHLHMGDVFPHGKRETTASIIGVRHKAPYNVDLGSDFFQAHRIMFVPDKHVALFTYNGGAVF